MKPPSLRTAAWCSRCAFLTAKERWPTWSSASTRSRATGPNNPHFGSLIGRYANRIAGGRFSLNGAGYRIPTNNNGNALHGGPLGFDKLVWKAKRIGNGVELEHTSPDGDQGFPGTLTAVVRYTLSGGALKIEYGATTAKPTVVNLSNHSYFNLSGGASADVLGHELTIHAARFTPVNATLIPTGELRPVAGTPFDFRQARRVGERIDEKDSQIEAGRGYDHNFVLDSPGKLRVVAELYEPGSGRVLTVSTTEPGVQFYTGNYLNGSAIGKGGRSYGRRAGLCLETQHFPDSPNHPDFPSTVLNPGERFHSVTIFAFSAR
ncbi:MAG TPA: aldose epimerase family protein [Terriglobales bacterium]|nr:aldose epimerase family protein [Terriglobales bacterium]